jgi:hypothetical protein
MSIPKHTGDYFLGLSYARDSSRKFLELRQEKYIDVYCGLLA